MCGESIKHICSAGLLRDTGYGLQLQRVPRRVRLCNRMEVLIAVYSENRMPYVVLSDLLNLLDLNNVEVQLVDAVL